MSKLDLETYNRVPNLESTVFKNVLVGIMITLFVSTAACAVAFIVLIKPPTLVAWGGALSGLALIILGVIYRRRKRRCQFCGSALGTVLRPFLLTSKYLAIQGVKQGNYFYMKSNKTLQSAWVKISNQTVACHHCRLTEEQHSEFTEPVTQAELETLKQPMQ